ncbi:DEAD/DEAH box helicase family protein [Candidatus Palauibacter polyketidifaciens]|uniref:type I restriction endonuclease subunit R n=1 Tax=Candidatus Palauibacter polyketidifaciens TaxID=3056740 RepID=UPI002386CE4B|nr:DEAD/DEAH box helicase family protein [Candidatus Palauibacter polyketidifaciens]MDE2719292.1 DEAD/DEAH box helicase family protein [Candidatus Palauibacter polyketidifaciens]
MKIDGQLEACGWVVQDFASMNIHAGRGVAVREFPLRWTDGAEIRRGSADYLLYADGWAVGVIEAKPAGHTLQGVVVQSKRYTEGLDEQVPARYRPLPFAYESTGEVTQFTNGLDPDPRSREIFTFHRPEELLRLQDLGSEQLRRLLRKMPDLPQGKLWPVQHEAIANLELSLSHARPRALIQMATGSGKTFTAVSACHRLIKYAKAKRILFLVDRNNLGRQTLNEFQQFRDPSSAYTFSEEFVVQHLSGNAIDPASKVVITTIQRLYSILKGDPEYDPANEDESLFESARQPGSEPVPVEYTPDVPPEMFDFIVIDECHRSIYNVWRQVIEYFDAFLVGLTATPSPHTIGFFRHNVVQDYSHTKAVADGVNVGYDIYRIKTKISEEGGGLTAEAGRYVPRRDRRTRKTTLAELEDDLTYTATQLDRDVVAPDQIRLVVRTFRDHLFTEIFPGRTEVPKTLVFAKQDSHADDIVKIIKEEFGKGNDFCQKITSKTTGASPEDLLSSFRNSYNPRIAVTVDMIATGTDVKPLECLLFMRNVNSAGYFEQMKGRGVRVIDRDDLQSVTPDATDKTHFVIVDAVGVCERDKTVSPPLERRPSVSTEKLLQRVAMGIVDADLASSLASRLARLGRQVDEGQASRIARESGGQSLAGLTGRLLESIDPQATNEAALAKHGLPEDEEPSAEQLDAVERERMAEALKPFSQPGLRRAIVEIAQSLYQIIDEAAIDVLLDFGHSEAAVQSARSKLDDFQRFLEENKDDIEALRILYSRPYRAGLRYRHVKELRDALRNPPVGLHDPANGLWRLYEALEPERVQGRGGSALVDLVAIVKHAIGPEDTLAPVADQVEVRYQAWLEEKTHGGQEFTVEQRRWLDAIKDHIATSLVIERENFEDVPFNQWGGLGGAWQAFGEDLDGMLAELNERLAA